MKKFIYFIVAIYLVASAIFVFKYKKTKKTVFKPIKKIVINPKYIQTDAYDKGVKKIYAYKQWHMLDASGKKIKNSFDFVDIFYDDLSVVATNKKYGFIDKKMNIVIPLKFDYAESFSNGYAVIKENNKYGVINKKGKITSPPKYYDEISYFDYRGLARAKNFKDKKDHVINATGEIVKDLSNDPKN